MAAVWMRLRAGIRNRWIGRIGLALLAGILILLAAGSAIHVLVTSVRSRRRELAMLKTMGISRRQVREAVLVQATVLVGLALIPAIPLGIVAGRWLWTLTAHWLGITPDPITPLPAIGVIIAASVIGANLIAFIPASSAARTRPAVALRSE